MTDISQEIKYLELFITSMIILYSPLVLNLSEMFQCKLNNAGCSSGLRLLSCTPQNDSERKPDRNQHIQVT